MCINRLFIPVIVNGYDIIIPYLLLWSVMVFIINKVLKKQQKTNRVAIKESKGDQRKEKMNFINK